MRLKTMFMLAAVLFLIWGLILFFPDMILNTLGTGITPTNNEVYLARAISSLLLGMAVLAWMARNVGPSQARNAIVVCFVFSNALAAAVNIIGLLGGAVPQAAWGGVVVNGLLALGFALTGRQAK